MLGLDIGWNCYISLGSDSKPGQQQQQKGNLQEDVHEKNSTHTSSSYLNSANNKRNANHKKKFSASRSQKQKLFHQKKRLFNQHKNCSFTQSMPILKYSRPKKYLNVDGGTEIGGGISDNTSLIALSSQIVKFDLSNLGRKRKQQLKKRKTTERKLFRFESDDEEEEEEGEKEEDVEESSDSSSESELNFNISKRQSKKRLSHMNSKTSMTSSNKYNQKLNSISVTSNKYQDDENSSHQTNHSGRTLSETEILGNAVTKKINLVILYEIKLKLKLN